MEYSSHKNLKKTSLIPEGQKETGMAERQTENRMGEQSTFIHRFEFPVRIGGNLHSSGSRVR